MLFQNLKGKLGKLEYSKGGRKWLKFEFEDFKIIQKLMGLISRGNITLCSIDIKILIIKLR